MKKIFIIALLCATVGSLKAQNTFPSSGNVGIGITTPQAALDINGGIFLGGNNLDNRNGNLPLSFLENSGKMIIGWNRTGGAGEIDLFANQGGGNTGGFAFYNHDNNGLEKQMMWLTGDGRLLLGVSVSNIGNNKLAVGGGIIAESVTVKLQSNWPDYVFKPTYYLRPLSDVKSYIDLNHHLPDMPSEKEVADKGLDLGEMNKLLTKKVEELTLYLIEKDKENTELKKSLSKLEERMNLLEKANK